MALIRLATLVERIAKDPKPVIAEIPIRAFIDQMTSDRVRCITHWDLPCGAFRQVYNGIDLISQEDRFDDRYITY